MKKQTIIVSVVILMLLVLFLPIPRGTYEDGGTREYAALTYKIVAWNKLITEADSGDESAGGEHRYHKTSVFWIPDNYKQIDELWEIETAERDKPLENDIGETMYYVWEKGGFGSDFIITLEKDGTFWYSAGSLSSYIGVGEWTVDDGILTMTETISYDLTFRFSVEEDALVFISEGSDRFMYVTVENGDKFMAQDIDTLESYPVSNTGAGD